MQAPPVRAIPGVAAGLPADTTEAGSLQRALWDTMPHDEVVIWDLVKNTIGPLPEIKCAIRDWAEESRVQRCVPAANAVLHQLCPEALGARVRTSHAGDMPGDVERFPVPRLRPFPAPSDRSVVGRAWLSMRRLQTPKCLTSQPCGSFSARSRCPERTVVPQACQASSHAQARQVNCGGHFVACSRAPRSLSRDTRPPADSGVLRRQAVSGLGFRSWRG